MRYLSWEELRWALLTWLLGLRKWKKKKQDCMA